MDNVMEGQLMESRQDAAVTDEMENLRKKYKERDGRIYEIRTTIQEDDEEEKNLYFFSGNQEPHPMRDMSNCRPILQ